MKLVLITLIKSGLRSFEQIFFLSLCHPKLTPMRVCVSGCFLEGGDIQPSSDD